MADIKLTDSIGTLPMIGTAYTQKLARLNLHSVSDLLYHYPARYLDFSHITPIKDLKVGDTVTVSGNIVSLQNIYTRSHKNFQKAIIKDATGTISATWFNMPFLAKSLKTNSRVSLAGTVSSYLNQLTLVSPEHELVTTDHLHTGRIIPIYPETRGLSSKWLRSRIKTALTSLHSNQVIDWLPPEIVRENNLITLVDALKQIHFPDDQEKLSLALERLKFNELFLVQWQALKQKQDLQKISLSHPLVVKQEKVIQLIKSLPFKLTRDQNKVIAEILTDLSRPIPMHRLLAGDVGSGKTAVAAVAAFVCQQNHLQTIFMAPTEILAQQHYQTLSTIFSHTDTSIALVTSSTKKQVTKSKLQNSDILIGTHALLHQKLSLNKVGLLIIDEQHRFGVNQRDQLLANQASQPHLLMMTATPIPRTVAMAIYAHLDVSTIINSPQGRQKIKTWVVPEAKRTKAYSWVDRHLTTSASQAFVVCPLIEPSASESLQDIKSVKAEFDRLSKVFPHRQLTLLHGRMKSAEKTTAITRFSQNLSSLLVATPVIEVGIDIPNASIMIIEGAERFGLAQLHQLRGRVGRGLKASYCLIFTSSKNSQTLERLKALETNHSGIKLAEIDLKLRGPGDIYGLRQHGFNQFKLAKLSDSQLIATSRKAALQCLNKPIIQATIGNYASITEAKTINQKKREKKSGH